MNPSGAPELICKLTDFGFAIALEPDNKATQKLGTHAYMAPEILAGEEYDEKVDTWALGVLTYVMMTASYPFPGKTKRKIAE